MAEEKPPTKQQRRWNPLRWIRRGKNNNRANNNRPEEDPAAPLFPAIGENTAHYPTEKIGMNDEEEENSIVQAASTSYETYEGALSELNSNFVAGQNSAWSNCDFSLSSTGCSFVSNQIRVEVELLSQVSGLPGSNSKKSKKEKGAGTLENLSINIAAESQDEEEVDGLIPEVICMDSGEGPAPGNEENLKLPKNDDGTVRSLGTSLAEESHSLNSMEDHNDKKCKDEVSTAAETQDETSFVGTSNVGSSKGSLMLKEKYGFLKRIPSETQSLSGIGSKAKVFVSEHDPTRTLKTIETRSATEVVPFDAVVSEVTDASHDHASVASELSSVLILLEDEESTAVEGPPIQSKQESFDESAVDEGGPSKASSRQQSRAGPSNLSRGSTGQRRGASSTNSSRASKQRSETSETHRSGASVASRNAASDPRSQATELDFEFEEFSEATESSEESVENESTDDEDTHGEDSEEENTEYTGSAGDETETSDEGVDESVSAQDQTLSTGHKSADDESDGVNVTAIQDASTKQESDSEGGGTSSSSESSDGDSGIPDGDTQQANDLFELDVIPRKSNLKPIVMNRNSTTSSRSTGTSISSLGPPPLLELRLRTATGMDGKEKEQIRKQSFETGVRSREMFDFSDFDAERVRVGVAPQNRRRGLGYWPRAVPDLMSVSGSGSGSYSTESYELVDVDDGPMMLCSAIDDYDFESDDETILVPDGICRF